jgi:hypothetical protein
MMEKLRMWFIERDCTAPRVPVGAQGDERKAVCVQRRRGCLGRTGTGEKLKKRRVQSGDAPSNRTFGNCLLGVHCSQKHRPEAAPMLDSQPLQGANRKIDQQVIHRLEAGLWTAASGTAR